MIKAKIMLGAAADRYEETGKFPSVQWANKNGGSVFEKEFTSETEYKAFAEGLKETLDNWACVITERTTKDCFFCHNWREFFKDKTTQVYCPDCGQVILN